MISILKSVDFIAAEDTRVTQRLCHRFDIRTPLLSVHKFNEKFQSAQLLDRLKSGQSMALVSDAGAPGISDPGALFVDAIHTAGISVVSVPGPSAMTSLISISGMTAVPFCFLGFLPKKKGDILRLIASFKSLDAPLCFYESPSRLFTSLTLIHSEFGIQEVCLGKELTKRFETVVRGDFQQVTSVLETIPIKGEWCGLIRLTPQTPHGSLSDDIHFLRNKNISNKNISDILTHLLHYPRNLVYNALLKNSL